MARHHIRDNEGNLHFFNDEEYRQYKFNKGCFGVLALLFFVIGGIVSTCNNDKKTSSSAYSDDTRSPIPVISVHSVGNLQYRRQS